MCLVEEPATLEDITDMYDLHGIFSIQRIESTALENFKHAWSVLGDKEGG
jgi:hypothetical protein